MILRLSWLVLWTLACGALFACSASEDNADHDDAAPTSDDDDNDDNDDASPEPTPPPNAIDFPDGFQWGVSTSAYQTEGGNLASDYTRWSIQRTGKDLCGDAADSYHRFAEDAQLAADLGVGLYRIGIEWARVEPERDQVDEGEIAHYRQVIQAVVDRGMRPMVTLHHFTNPQWIQDQDAWLNADTVDQFVEHARRMAQEYGDQVDWWLTINEPVIYTAGAYLMWGYPGGGINNFKKMSAATVNLTFAHARAYHAIKAADAIDADGDGRATIVSIAQAIVPGRPRRPENANDVASAAAYDYVMNRQYLDSVTSGMLDVNGDGEAIDQDTAPPEGYYDELAGTLDFLGVNFYNSVAVLHVPLVFGPVQGIPCFPQADFLCYPLGRPPYLQGDNGNPIEPDVFGELLVEYGAAYGLPVYVTENGVAATDGYLRSWYIIEHLKAARAALDQGCDLRAYMHWSLIDNFEWLQAYSMRFGLYAVDFATFARSPTEGGQTYAAIVHAGGVSQELLDRYAEAPPPPD